MTMLEIETERVPLQSLLAGGRSCRHVRFDGGHQASPPWVDRHDASSAGVLVHAGAPVVELLPQLEVQETLGRDHVGQRADPVRDVEQRAAVGADELDEDVELSRGDDDVVRLGPAGDLVGDRLRRAGRADADHRLGLEPEPERVRDPGHLEDVVRRTAVRSGPGSSPPRRRASAAMRRKGSRPFACSASMIPLSTVSTRRARAHGPARGGGPVPPLVRSVRIARTYLSLRRIASICGEFAFERRMRTRAHYSPCPRSGPFRIRAQRGNKHRAGRGAVRSSTATLPARIRAQRGNKHGSGSPADAAIRSSSPHPQATGSSSG